LNLLGSTPANAAAKRASVLLAPSTLRIHAHAMKSPYLRILNYYYFEKKVVSGWWKGKENQGKGWMDGQEEGNTEGGDTHASP
jgi:hypothetical protein